MMWVITGWCITAIVLALFIVSDFRRYCEIEGLKKAYTASQDSINRARKLIADATGHECSLHDGMKLIHVKYCDMETRARTFEENQKHLTDWVDSIAEKLTTALGTNVDPTNIQLVDDAVAVIIQQRDDLRINRESHETELRNHRKEIDRLDGELVVSHSKNGDLMKQHESFQKQARIEIAGLQDDLKKMQVELCESEQKVQGFSSSLENAQENERIISDAAELSRNQRDAAVATLRKTVNDLSHSLEAMDKEWSA